MKLLIEFFAKKSTLVNVITVFVFLFGFYALKEIKREAFPNIDFDIVQIQTVYPSASPDTVEKLITNPLEQALVEVDGIKKMYSVSTESVSMIFLTLDPDVTDSVKGKQDIKDVTDSWTGLPETAEDPVVTTVETKRTPVITVTLSGDVEEAILRDAAKSFEAPLEKLRDVANVNFKGVRDYEIKVETNPEKLSKYKVSINELLAALSENNINIPGGTIEASPGSKEMIVRTVGELNNEEDVKNTVVRANAIGKPILVKDVADVEFGFKKSSTLNRINGKNAVGITVVKKESGDVIRLVEQVKELINSDLKDRLEPGIELSYINDSSYFVKRRLNVLMSNMTVGLVLVLVILSLILPVRIAFITAFGIPFAFLLAIGAMYLGGFSINLISMMGLIIVLGMLVDDAVVVTENAQAAIEAGNSPMDAAVKGTSQIVAPVTASVFTTILAFGPLVFMSGIFGKFVQSIPVGVIIALIASLIECFFILPNHIAHWVKEQAKGQKQSKGVFADFWDNKVVPLYEKVIYQTLRFRYLMVVGLVLFFVGVGALFATQMKFILFPAGGVDTFLIRVDGTVATPLEETAKNVEPIEKAIAQLSDEEVQDFSAVIGQHSGDGGRGATGTHLAEITVFLTPEIERNRGADEIINELKESIGQPEGFNNITFTQRKGGPPVGKGVAIGVRGADYDEIMLAVEELKIILQDVKGVSDVEDTYSKGKDEIHVVVDKVKAAASGLTPGSIGRTVRAAYEGIIPTSIKTLSEEIDIRVILPEEDRKSAEALSNLKIGNIRNQRVPLSKVARFETKPSIAAYEHEGNQRQILVEAEVDNKVTSSREVNKAMEEKILPLKEKYKNLEFFFGGENEDTQESLKSLVTSFAFAFFGIFLLLVLLFQNLLQPVLISLTIPVGIASVIIAFFIHGLPVSFLGSIGIIALAGVIVNNSIVLTDFVNNARSEGLNNRDSIMRAAKVRLRPIFLTTLTTVAGILPTAYGWGGLDPFVVPIAIALGWGLAFGAIVITLIFPCLIAISDDIRNIKNLFRRKKA